MAYLKVYDDNYESLVKILPMDDTLFTAKLTSKSLLPEDVGSQIDSLSTRADKAKHFLKNVIKPSLDINDTRDLNNFISIMENNDYRPLNTVAAKMKTELEGTCSILYCKLCIKANGCLFMLIMVEDRVILG